MKKIVFILLIILAVAVAVTAMAGTKTALFEDQTGSITAGATYGDDTNSFEVTDPSLFKCLKVEGLDSTDHLNLMREDYAGTGWKNVTSGTGVVQINTDMTSVCPIEIGTYALDGNISGTVTAYTEE